MINYGISLGKSNNVNSNDFFVTADWLHKKIEEGGQDIVILDFSYNNSIQNEDARKKLSQMDASHPFHRKYEEKHIPTAIPIFIGEIEDKETFNIKDANIIKEVLQNKGISTDKTVVVYSDDQCIAAYVVFIIYWLGIDNVKFLDGGLIGWEEKGYNFEEGINVAAEPGKIDIQVPKRPNILLKTPDDLLKAKQQNPDIIIASVRNWQEYLNEISGYSYVTTSDNMEVAGAVYAKSSYHNDCAYFVNKEFVYDSPEAMKSWREWGINPSEEIVFYCGGGYRAALVFFIAKTLGFDKVRMFQGGSFQWNKYHRINPKKYPVQVGDPRTNKFKIIDG
ncbi:sulfurtransferase [Falseniella ignava]|uniref:thiosulfate sulfurtransferase n=1 Tax=Falseniella ignava CCUG 37419 TaxID=883112 RepID=K1LMB6_9LACT|nr:rhodanese-like domain-containing protein [Falseniella ignava]EKB55756.1 hypothetical protein HMPREF9707_00943 [Falseniella ignava CCUG 37419]